MLLFASCGKQHQAETVVKEFMQENLKEPSALKSMAFKSLDSTKVIGDSLIAVLRKGAQESSRYKSSMEFAERGTETKLMITRVTYKLNDEEFQDTYYLDGSLSSVVAVKCN